MHALIDCGTGAETVHVLGTLDQCADWVMRYQANEQGASQCHWGKAKRASVAGRRGLRRKELATTARRRRQLEGHVRPIVSVDVCTL